MQNCVRRGPRLTNHRPVTNTSRPASSRIAERTSARIENLSIDQSFVHTDDQKRYVIQDAT